MEQSIKPVPSLEMELRDTVQIIDYLVGEISKRYSTPKNVVLEHTIRLWEQLQPHKEDQP